MNRQSIPGARPATQPMNRTTPQQQQQQQQQSQQQQGPLPPPPQQLPPHAQASQSRVQNGLGGMGMSGSSLASGKQLVNGNLWNQAPPLAASSRPGGPGAASFAQAVSNSGLSNSNGVASGPGSQAAQASLDLSDFPALGSVGSGSGSGSQSIRTQSPRPGQQQQQQQQYPPPGLQQHQPAEDFPALPGSSSTASSTNTTTAAAVVAAAAAAGNAAPTIHSKSDLDRFGMNGLSGVIRMENNDQTTVAIGTEVNKFGLDFNPGTGEQLSKTFSSPWIATSKHRVEPEYELPSCYTVPSAVPQQNKIQNLTEETLFYIFYTMPRDSMQESAAQELVNRNWRYHKQLKLWLTKDPLSEPIPQPGQAERGVYVFFDPSVWEKVKQEYTLRYADIA